MSKTQRRLAAEFALIAILRQGKQHHAFPLIIELQARQRACLRRVTINSVEEGQGMIESLVEQMGKAVLIVVIPDSNSRAVGLKSWTVNPAGFLSDVRDMKPEVLERKRVIA